MRDFMRSKAFGWDIPAFGRQLRLGGFGAPPPPAFRVLSISGGGFMGFYTALVLAEMEKRAERPLGECFDLISGTSIGGIIALALSQGVPMQEVVSAFDERGEKIFPQRALSRSQIFQLMDTMRQLSGAKYDVQALRDTIAKFLPEELRMRDIERRVAIPAVNLSRGTPHVFRTGYAPRREDEKCWLDTPAIDVALATSAAPTLLPIHEISGEYFSDGGTFANSPDQIALHEAEIICGIPSERVEMLSVGTSSAGYHFPDPQTRSFGLREWAEDQRIVKVTLATQQNHAQSLVKARLRDRYLRIDEAQTTEEALDLGLDTAGPLARAHLRNIAQRTISRLDTIDALREFLAHEGQRLDCEPEGERPLEVM